ncbi:MAG: cytochrome c [Novosphingobium sp.]|nr:cytochrome c [Novosphingobium sp.]
MLRYGLAAIGLVALSAGIAFHQPATAAGESPKIKASAHLYDTYCAQCHGIRRDGKGVNVVGLTVQPRDHSDTAAMSSLPRDQMVKAIAEGGAAVNKSALMPTWSGLLTEQEIEDMADYLIYVCKCDQSK